MVEQAHRPRTRRAPLHRGPLVHARAPSRQADRRGGEDTMSTTDPTRDQHERRQNAPEPTTDHSVPEDPEKAGTPEAVQAAKTAHRNRGMGPKSVDDARRVRGVEWVRPTDLLARQSATVAGRGIDFEVELAHRTANSPATSPAPAAAVSARPRRRSVSGRGGCPMSR